MNVKAIIEDNCINFITKNYINTPFISRYLPIDEKTRYSLALELERVIIKCFY